MKRIALLAMIGLLAAAAPAMAQSNISPIDKWSWGENVGWFNWRDANGGVDGVRVTKNWLEGYIWGENVGWVNVGNGPGPYLNANGANFGVNIDAANDCFGFAWSENLGWINFDTRMELGPFGQQARFDFVAGRFFGYAWSENAGWINLNNPIHFVAITNITCFGDLDNNGTVDAADLALLLGAWGPPGGGTPADLDNNGTVDAADLALLLGAWGPCPC